MKLRILIRNGAQVFQKLEWNMVWATTDPKNESQFTHWIDIPVVVEKEEEDSKK